MDQPETPDKDVPGVANRLRILVVDDNVDCADSTAVLLTLYGHTAQTATSGTAAIAAMAHQQFDVVLLDMSLPGMSGNDLAKWIRNQLRDRPPVLIALTGRGDDATRQLSAENGIDHYLLKPADPQYLKAILDRLVV